MLAQPRPAAAAQDAFKSPYEAVDESTDAASARLIADLLAQDLEAASNLHAAEQIQMQLLLDDSRPGSPAYDPTAFTVETNDRVEALRLALDTATSQALEKEQLASTADSNWARQLGQQFDAQRRKERLDSEFATTLQKADDEGADVDAFNAQEAETMLGRGRVAALLAPAIAEPAEPAPQPLQNAKGKGKALDTHHHEEPRPAVQALPAQPLSTCSICLEPVTPTSNPFEASKSAAGSNMIPFGIFLGERTDQHIGCLDCLAGYIQSKLQDGQKKAFPIKCPECPHEITDNEAARICLAVYHRKLLDSTPAIYCPHPRCSERVLLPEEEVDTTQAQCPSCSKLMCTSCKSIWHTGYTCDEYQDLPEDARNPDDLAVLKLADSKGWRRCPECRMVVELTHGCNHIQCACSHHWCFQCGKTWDIPNVRCTNVPPCKLWDEDRLVEPEPADAGRPRPLAPAPARRVQDMPGRGGRRPPQQQQRPRRGQPGFGLDDDVHAAARQAARDWQLELERQNAELAERQREVDRIEERRDALSGRALDWMETGGPRPQRTHVPPHAFTQDFVQRHLCRYCNHQAYSLPDLKEHFMEASHGVYSCCERFFRRLEDLQKHLDAIPGKYHDCVALSAE